MDASFVAPETILAASMFRFSSFLASSTDMLSHMISAYSRIGRTYEKYSISKDLRFRTNLFFLSTFSLEDAFPKIAST